MLKEVPEFFHVQGLPHQFSHSPLVCSEYNGSFLGGGEGGLTMALQSTTIHQYDWLVKASSHQACLQHTHSLGAQCQELV